MESLKNIDNIKYEYVEQLSENGLAQLLDNLTKKYYQAYVDGDADKMNSTIDFINDIELIVEDKLFEFGDYMNYLMLTNAISIISIVFKNGLELKPYIDATLDKNDSVKSFAKSFERNRYAFITGNDRINIKNLYEVCKADESLDSGIMDIVEKLYCSFIDKEIECGGADE